MLMLKVTTICVRGGEAQGFTAKPNYVQMHQRVICLAKSSLILFSIFSTTFPCARISIIRNKSKWNCKQSAINVLHRWKSIEVHMYQSFMQQKLSQLKYVFVPLFVKPHADLLCRYTFLYEANR